MFNLFPSLSFSSEGFFINNKTKYSISDITLWNLTKHILRFKLRKEIFFIILYQLQALIKIKYYMLLRFLSTVEFGGQIKSTKALCDFIINESI